MVTSQKYALRLRSKQRFEGYGWTHCLRPKPSNTVKSELSNRAIALTFWRHNAKNPRNRARNPASFFAAFFLSGTILVTPIIAPNLARSATPQSDQTVGRFAEYISEAAIRFAIPEHWIRVVMQVESADDIQAISPKGAMGLMQIMPRTWTELREQYALGDDPFWPRDNILAGAAYLRMMHDRFGSPGFLAAYNAGPKRFEQFLFDGRPLPQETIRYVMRLAPMVGADPTELSLPTSPRTGDWRNAPLFVGPLDANRAADVPTNEQLQHAPILDASNDMFVPRQAGSETR